MTCHLGSDSPARGARSGSSISAVLLTVESVVFLCSCGTVADRPEVPGIVDAVEEMRIVSSDSSLATSLTALTGLVVLPDGTIVTAHQRERVIRFFDSSGTFIRMVGGQGEGPTEFPDLTRLGIVDGTIYVPHGTYPIKFLSFDGQFLPQMVRAPPAVGISSRSVGGIMTGRVFLQTTTYFTAMQGRGVEVDSTATELRDTSGTLIGGYTHPLPTGDESFTAHVGAGSWKVFRPLLPAVRSVIAPDGTDAIVLIPGEYWSGAPGEVRVRRLLPDGSSTEVEARLPAVAIEARHADSIVAEATEDFEQTYPDATVADRDRYVEDYRTGMGLPEHFPPFRTFVYGVDDLLWVATHSDIALRIVLRTDGTVVKQVRFPVGLNLRWATSDHAWGTLEDANGLPVIVRYRIPPGPS